MGIKTLQIVGDSAYGGASYLILQWCRYLLDHGCEVNVLATNETFVRELKRIPNLKVLDNIFIPRDIVLYQDIKAFFKVIQISDENRYQVVHTYTATPSILGRIAARLTCVPVIVHHQAGWTVTEYSSMFERLFYTPLEYIAALASSKSICVSHAVAEQARELHIIPLKKIVTICNGIQVDPFLCKSDGDSRDALRRKFKIPINCVVVGAIGRLSPQKDNATLIKAIAAVKILMPATPIRLLIAGDGPERQSLERLALSLGINDQVTFMGFQKDIASFLAGIDYFVSSSLREGLSIAVLEAMAAARPIIATSILPNAELIQHELTGLLVPPKDPQQLAEAIARFVEDENLAQKCATAARQRVLEQYTIDRMFDETWDLYQDLLSKSKVKNRRQYLAVNDNER